MASVESQGTGLTVSIRPSKRAQEWATVAIGVKNEYIDYAQEEEISAEQMEELLVSLSRLLAGAYKREYSLSLENAGLAVDMYPHAARASREERRKGDCVVAFRLLMRSKDKAFLGGVYTLLLHRKELEGFVDELWSEYRENCLQRIPGSGKYRFIGVSPRGRKGCNYQYLDETGEEFKVGDYAWVRMGRRRIEQVVHIDSIRLYGDEDAPYNPQSVKRILRKATKEEIKAYLKEWE